MMTEMEQLGGMVQCISSREGLLYCVDVLRENLDAAMDILADTVLNPLLSQEEIDDCKEIIKLQQNEMPADMLSRDAVQVAAYKGSPLGNSHFCPEANIEGIDASLITDFRDKYFLGDNCFISGAGVEHEHFVELVERKFKYIPSGTRSHTKKSEFVGGLVADERQLKEPFIKIAIAFEIGGWHDSMLVPTCVLQQLLGGGSSFSAGGPGKGMYTRLYREILNQHHWCESAEAFVNIHDDAGIMGIDGACPPEYATSLIRVIIDQLTKLAVTPVTDEELSRAKKMLKSMMMMQLESRLVLCEDIARQYSTYGKRESPTAVCERIDAVTAEDLMGVARRMMLTRPAVGCVGHDLSKVPTYDDIDTFTEKYRIEMAKGNLKSD
jgi:processing peptidase subunit alpha